MLEVCFERTYEGEPAMKLESIVEPTDEYIKPIIVEVEEESIYSKPYIDDDWKAKKDKVKVLKVSPIITELLERYIDAKDKKAVRGNLAYLMIDYLARGFAEIVPKGYPIVVSGGVTFNSYFTPLLEKYLGKIYLNEKVSPGDNGISLGQIYIGRFLAELE